MRKAGPEKALVLGQLEKKLWLPPRSLAAADELLMFSHSGLSDSL